MKFLWQNFVIRLLVIKNKNHAQIRTKKLIWFMLMVGSILWEYKVTVVASIEFTCWINEMERQVVVKIASRKFDGT